MTVDAINGAAQTTVRAQTQSEAAVLSSDFETFLKMLTVQMQNQDPLNPTDTTEFATQLATFSALEQQVLTNSLLETLSSALAGTDPLSATNLLGQSVQVTGQATFNGTPIDLAVTVDPGADSATLSVRDANGGLVQSLPFDPSNRSITWAGVHDNGQAMPLGNYSFDVESWHGQNALGTSPTARYATVVEVRVADGGTSLILEDGSQIDATEVVGVRATSS